MNSNEITLQKEVLREGAWEVLARVHKLMNLYQDNPILNAIENELSKNIRNIPKKNSKEVDIFLENIKFLNNILKNSQGVE